LNISLVLPNYQHHRSEQERFTIPLDSLYLHHYHFASFGLTIDPQYKNTDQSVAEDLFGACIPNSGREGEALESTNVEGSG
jgi:hypothetical protein